MPCLKGMDRRVSNTNQIKQTEMNKDFLKELGLEAKNDGTVTGLETIRTTENYIDSHSPVDGSLIGNK